MHAHDLSYSCPALRSPGIHRDPVRTGTGQSSVVSGVASCWGGHFLAKLTRTRILNLLKSMPGRQSPRLQTSARMILQQLFQDPVPQP